MDKQQEIQLQQLLKSFADGHLAEKDYHLLAKLLDQPGTEAVWESMFLAEIEAKEGMNAEGSNNGQKIWEQIQKLKDRQSQKIDTAQMTARRDPKVFWLGKNRIAIAVILIVLCGGYLMSRVSKTKLPFAPAPKNKTAGAILPGTRGAILHLADGKTINLNNVHNGVIATQKGIQIIKEGDAINYVGKAGDQIYNEISTDRGKQWNFVLPDGSSVWLNAGSSIRYPLAFEKGERVVEMHGEAYFEIKHDARRPFKVRVNGQIIEDIGTAFNINAYADNEITKTTLISGSIRLHLGKKSVLMKPGEQALVNNQIRVNMISDPSSAIAWKNGMFQFADANLEDIMRQLARWYNVDVVYRSKPRVHQFTGKIPNTMDIKDVLDILEQAGVHFKVEQIANNGRNGRIIVSP